MSLQKFGQSLYGQRKNSGREFGVHKIIHTDDVK